MFKNKRLKSFKKIQNILYDQITVTSDKYGSFYPPVYNPYAVFNNQGADFYSKEGTRLEPFFLRDFHTAHEPYFFRSDYFFMDRFNFGLDTHFYTHNCMLEQMGRPSHRYGILYESRSIVPEDYLIFKKNKGLERDFDKVFSFSADILNSVPNACFVPFQAAPWYGTERWGGVIDENAWQHKCRDISFLSSNKVLCDMHRIRYDLIMKCKREGLADTYGTFDGGTYASLQDVLAPYRYSIVMENEIDDFYFSERLTNCFLSMTIPIYFGAPKIGKFFNPDGIIQFGKDDISDIGAVLKSCTQENYEARLLAVCENFKRVQKFKNVFDWMYLEYLRG